MRFYLKFIVTLILDSIIHIILNIQSIVTKRVGCLRVI